MRFRHLVILAAMAIAMCAIAMAAVIYYTEGVYRGYQ